MQKVAHLDLLQLFIHVSTADVNPTLTWETNMPACSFKFQTRMLESCPAVNSVLLAKAMEYTWPCETQQ